MPDLPLDPHDRDDGRDGLRTSSGYDGDDRTVPVTPVDRGSYGTEPVEGSAFDRSAYGMPTEPIERPAFGSAAYGTSTERTAFDASPYGAPDQPAAGFSGPVHTGVRNGMGTAALVLGILGFLSAIFLIGGLLGLVAIVLGAIGIGRVNRREATNRGSAVAGVVLGLLSVAIATGVGIAGKTFYDRNKDEITNVTECLEDATTSEARAACADRFEDAVTK